MSLYAAMARPFLPPIHTARAYSARKFRRDLIAGLTVAVVEVPQAMAYALVAGVPPQYGIYTSIIQGIIGALLSSSEHITTGPTNTQSLLIASVVTRIATTSPENGPALYLQLVFALTFLKGIIQLGFAAARFGDLTRYVSRSVIVGVAAGAGVLIAVGQVPNFLGITSERASTLPGILGAIERMAPHLGEVNTLALGIGCACLAVVVICRWISRFAPGSLLAIVAGALIVWMTGSTGDLPTIGSLPRGLPHFQTPWVSWEHTQDLLPGAMALAVLGLLESVAIAKTIAAQTGERIIANQESFAQGLKNLISSFFQCIPGSASFTRSALDFAAGAQTRFAAVYNALFVAVIFFAFAELGRLVPLASLAAVLLMISWRLIDWGYFPRMLRTSRSDALVFAVTVIATLIAPLEWAIFVGIFLNIALYLRTASHLHLAEMVQAPAGAGTFLERPIADRSTGEQRVMFLQLEGDLFFGVADELQEQLTKLTHQPGLRVVILRLKRTHSLDATVLHVLEQFTREMKARGGHVILCGLRTELMTVLKSYGLIDQIGRENVFEAGVGVFTSAKRALERARQLVAASIDTAAIAKDLEAEAHSYEI